MKKRALFIVSGMLLSGCTLYQKAVVPSFKKPSHFKYAIKARFPQLHYRWWENFNDKRLNRLVRLALEHNINYGVSLKNIEIAITYVTQNESYLFPQISTTFNTSRNKSMSIFSTNNFVTSANPSIANNAGLGSAGLGRVYNLEQLFGSLSYQADVWNQIGNTIKQSKANVATSMADSDVVKLTLITGVVNTWFQINALEANIINLKQQLNVTRGLLNLVQSQYRGQLVDIAVVDDAKNQMEGITVNLINVQKQQEIFVNTLAYLLGLTPEELPPIHPHARNPLRYSNLIPAGIPSHMVANRPDIQSAYFQVLSYGYLKKQTLANFLPSFTITGNYGYASQTFSQFFSPTNVFWNYGLSVLQPIFDYKLRMSEYKRSQFQYEAAFLTYKNTVINAYQEVNNALLSYQKDNEVLHAYQHELTNSQEKYRAAKAQYQSGYADYSIYLTDKLFYLQTENQLITERLIVAQDVVQVYKTLGLGLCVENPL